MDNTGKAKKTSELSKISHRLRSAKLLKVGLKTGLKAAESAVSVALGKKTKQASYDTLLEESMRYFVGEVSELKGGLMKAGQMLSVYGEHFFPPEVNKVLKSLQSDSKVVAFSTMSKKIRSSLGEKRYSRLRVEPKPIGAASLGQVYRVQVFADDQQTIEQKTPFQTMALKVQYPRVQGAIEADLVAVRKLMKVLKLLPNSSRYDLIYDEIKTMLHYEVDYTRELRYYQKYAKLLQGDPILRVPKVYPELSTKTLLAMELVQGRRLDEISFLSQERRNRFALGIMRLLYSELFRWRVVQTDPHIGNFVVQIKEDGYQEDALYLLDFGAVRRFGKEYIENFRSLALHSLENRPSKILYYGEKLGFMKPSDTEEMQELFVRIALKAVEPFSEKYAGKCDPSGEYQKHEYDWSDLEVVHEISKLARNAAFAFKFRPPPKEAIFIDRKLVGSVTLLKVLGAKLGPRDLALSYLKDLSHD